jgi:hypothetical protein
MTLEAGVDAKPAVPDYPRAFLRRLPPARAQGRAGRSTVTESDLDDLPAAAQRYLRFMGVLGRPRAEGLWVRCTGQFRRSRSARPLSCTTWQ